MVASQTCNRIRSCQLFRKKRDVILAHRPEFQARVDIEFDFDVRRPHPEQ